LISGDAGLEITWSNHASNSEIGWAIAQVFHPDNEPADPFGEGGQGDLISVVSRDFDYVSLLSSNSGSVTTTAFD
jgi:hypothetical protein